MIFSEDIPPLLKSYDVQTEATFWDDSYEVLALYDKELSSLYQRMIYSFFVFPSK